MRPDFFCFPILKPTLKAYLRQPKHVTNFESTNETPCEGHMV